MKAELEPPQAKDPFFSIKDIADALGEDNHKNVRPRAKKAADELGITPKTIPGKRGRWLGFKRDDANMIIKVLTEKKEQRLNPDLIFPDEQAVNVPKNISPYLKVVIDNHQNGKTSSLEDFSSLIADPKTPLSQRQKKLIIRKLQDVNSNLQKSDCEWRVVNVNKGTGRKAAWDIQQTIKAKNSEQEKPKKNKRQQEVLVTSSIKILSNLAEQKPIADNNNQSISIHVESCLDPGENLPSVFNLGDDLTEKLKQIFISDFVSHLEKWITEENFKHPLTEDQREKIKGYIAILQTQFRTPLVPTIVQQVCIFFAIPIPDKYRTNTNGYVIWALNP